VARVEEGWSENRACRQRFEETYPLVLMNRLHGEPPPPNVSLLGNAMLVDLILSSLLWVWVAEEDWLAIIRKVNEFWGESRVMSCVVCRVSSCVVGCHARRVGKNILVTGPIVEESHKLCKMDGLLSYTILSVPVHMAKQRRLEHAITAARRHICSFLDKVHLSNRSQPLTTHARHTRHTRRTRRTRTRHSAKAHSYVADQRGRAGWSH
jgi:hypothetical protein